MRMIAQGWVAEGYGDDGVAMCVPHWAWLLERLS